MLHLRPPRSLQLLVHSSLLWFEHAGVGSEFVMRRTYGCMLLQPLVRMLEREFFFCHVFSAVVPFHALITSLLDAMSALHALPGLHYENSARSSKGPQGPYKAPKGLIRPLRAL